MLYLKINILIIIFIIIKLNLAETIAINPALLKNSTFRAGKTLTPTNNVEQCTTQTELTGLCMRRTECTRNGGIVAGYCSNFGVCCELNLKCSGTSKLKKTIIRNPEKIPHKCKYHIQAYSSRVCQLRVDFDIVIAQPTIPDSNNGIPLVTCIADKFETGLMTICGANIKQHMYLNFDTANGDTDAIFSFTLSDSERNPNLQRYWNIVITQLECPSIFRAKENTLSNYKMLLKQPLGDIELLAPQGCLQYFHEPQGIIESFNYNEGIGPYLGNMRYGICFKRTIDDKGVQLSGTVFEIGAAKYTNEFIDSDCHSVDNPNNIADYLEIPESVLDTSPTELYGTFYCGNSLQGNTLFHAPPGPFAIYFISDKFYSTEYLESGFQLKYSII